MQQNDVVIISRTLFNDFFYVRYQHFETQKKDMRNIYNIAKYSDILHYRQHI